MTLIDWTSNYDSQLQPSPWIHNCICQLVMNSDQYVLAAIALVRSMKKHNMSQTVDFICFVNNISESSIQYMLKEFSFVVKINLITFATNKDIWPRFQKNYGWLDSCFTKFYILKLTMYQKALFLDSDMLCLENFSNLFKVPTPAGCLIPKEKSGFQTGCILPVNEVIKALIEGYGISGACFMLSPQQNDLENLLKRVNEVLLKNNGLYNENYDSLKLKDNDYDYCKYLKNKNFNAGPDEQLITAYNLYNWHNISRQYCCIPWLYKKFERGEFPIIYLDRISNKQESYQLSDELDLCNQNYQQLVNKQLPIKRTVYLIHFVAEKPWVKNGDKYWPDCKLFFDQLIDWDAGYEFVVQVFGDIKLNTYITQQEADNTYKKDFRRKFDK